MGNDAEYARFCYTEWRYNRSMTHHAPNIVIVDENGVRMASLSGELDVFSSSVLESRLLAGLPSDTSELVVDVSELSAIDSGGISALVRLREHGRSRGLTVGLRLGAVSQLNPTAHALLRRLWPVDVDLTALRAIPQPVAAHR